MKEFRELFIYTSPKPVLRSQCSIVWYGRNYDKKIYVVPWVSMSRRRVYELKNATAVVLKFKRLVFRYNWMHALK